MDPIVQTSSGAVRGCTDGDVSSFKGIPFAGPLTGAARFAAPSEPPRWDGTRDALEFSAAPPQGNLFPGVPSAWRPGDGDDSLSVNVWTPDPGRANLPVMVWIYGGAYLMGTARQPEYDGTNLARAGVVVVSFNYRVGLEGFGWLPGAPANRAFLDQLAALRWVQENIANFGGDPGNVTVFGGDPGNVTVFGESAGGTSVAALTASDAARGLFGKAIGQSIAHGFLSENRVRRTTERIADALGVPATVEGFAQVPSEAIHAVQMVPGEITPFGPVVDGDLLTDLPWRTLRADVDLVAGFTRDEFTLFVAGQDLSGADPAATADAVGLPAGAVAEYRAAHPGVSDADLHVLILSDRTFRMPTLWSAENHAGRSWCYELTWQSPALGGILRSCHGLDVPLTFGNFAGPLAEMLLGNPAPPEAEVLSAGIREAWVSFATTGDPGWPEYDKDDRLTRIWDVPVSVASDPIASSRRIWQAA
ncbi:carboxylesterase/lipase family protein [Amycolatopsis thermophila]|uniref:Para-nitrobenzyl esterase n=1 Tax=Amycolatopsis thermophila TaxID=206084 RepID=A0ABU0ERV8_9PSEU|nr:carboxylesterase family protein [Amycolatopsis thermophila]MDQ0378030.1 para-nitrobenzyl esterase [Amycolatopsis thermophila]